VVEETFFRGFLQPRIGIGLSTCLFAFAHLSYDQPLMLVGITALSLFYGALVRWRRNLWAAIVAHFLFDAIQLLVVIPAILKLLYKGG
jgi:membrane protease YdiL (CAAX protease family)